jgi:Zn-dependent metalloprotease
MDDFVVTQADYGGVHVNSGIPNRAFYLVATALGGNAWDSAGRIWYDTISTPGAGPGPITPVATFAEFAAATLATADSLYGAGSDESLAVVEGWKGVGVDALGPEQDVE